jgi:hypothetical protein
MPRTPDRFPGEREDEGVVLRDQGPAGLNNGDPTVEGGVRYVTDQFRLRDGFGVYNGRPIFVSTSAAPAVTDDAAAGHSVGMLWLRVSTGVLYVCQDITVGAAVWTSIVRNGDKGDITVSGDGASWTIDNDVVSNAKAANVPSPSLKGRTTTTTGDPEDLTLVNSATNTWNTATGGSISVERVALTGDVTASANSNATTIAANAVDNAKLSDMADSTVKGRAAGAGSGDPQNLNSTQLSALVTKTWAQTLAAGPSSGANNPVVSTSQYLGFGAVPPTAGNSEQIRADGSLRTYCNNDLRLDAATTWTAIGRSGQMTLQTLSGDIVANASGTMNVLASSGLQSTTTNGTNTVQSTNGAVALTAGTGLTATAATAVSLVAGTFVSVNNFLRFTEQSASTPTLIAGQALFWARADTPNVPMFTDDINADHVLQFRGEGMLADGDKGDIVVSGGFVTWTIDNDVVTNAKAANVPSPTIKGRTTAGTGDPEDLSPVNSTSNTWNTATPGSLSVERAALTGDVAAPANSNATTIAANAVTNTKAADMESPRLKGRTTAATGDPEDLSLVNSTSNSWNTATGGSISLERAAITGVVAASANSNTTTFGIGVDGAGLALSGGNTALDVVGSTSIVVTGDQVQRAALTGDVAAAQNSNATTIANDAVTNAKAANVPSPSLKGRTTATAGDPEDLTLVNSTSSSWNTSTGGSVSVERAALTGDVTAAANSNATAIANNAVSNAKAADVPSPSLKGRTTASTGDPEDLTLVGSTTNTWNTGTAGSISLERAALTGDVTAPANSNATTIAANAVTTAKVVNDAIDNTKLANMASPRIKGRTTATTGDPEDLTLVNSTTVAWNTATGGSISLERAALTGDVTASANSNATTIAANAVDNTKAADMATARLKGRTTAATGDPEDLTLTNSTTVSWNTSTGGTLSVERAALTGDVTAGANSNATTIANDAVSNAKLANVTSPSLKGRTTAAAGDPEDLTLVNSTTNSWNTATGGSVSVERAALTGDVTAPANSNATTIAATAVTNAKLANMAAATVKGRAIGAGTGDPTDLTSAQVGQLIRWTGGEVVTLTAGTTNTLTLLATTTYAFVNITGAGDVVVDAIAHGTSNLGARIVLVRNSASAGSRVIVRRNTGKGGSQIVTPGSADWVLDQLCSSVAIVHTTFNWQFEIASLPDGDRGDVTLSNVGQTWTIDNDVVSNAKAANVPSPSLKGRTTATIGDPEDLTLVNSATNTWNTSTGGSISLERTALTGDVTAPANSNATTIANNAVSNVKAADMAANSIKANATAATADPQDVTIGADSVLARVGGNLTSHPWSTLAGGGLTYNAGVMAVGAGTYVTVGANDVAVNRSALAADLDSTSIINNAGVLERAALTGDVTAAQNSNAATIANDVVSNAKLANMSPGCVKGVALGAPDPSDPQDLTGAQQGEMIRFAFNEFNVGGTNVPGTYHNVPLDARTKIVNINPSGATIITGWAMSGGNVGGEFILTKEGSTGSITLKHATGSSAGNQMALPRFVDYVLSSANDTVRIIKIGTFWVVQAITVSNDKLANMDSSRIKGRAEGAGTGDPQDLTPTQLATLLDQENFTWTGLHAWAGTAQFQSVVRDFTTNQVVPDPLPLNITLGATTNHLVITTNGDGEIQSITGASTFGRRVVVMIYGSGVKTIKSSSGTDSAIMGPGLQDFTCGTKTGFLLEGRGAGEGWLVVGGVTRVSDGDKGDITVSGSGTSWTIDDGVVTNAKLDNMAAGTVKGRALGAGPGDPTDLTPSQVASIIDGEAWSFRKSRRRYSWFDEFDHCAVPGGSGLALTTGIPAALPTSIGWIASANFSSGGAGVSHSNGEDNHPGIIAMQTGTNDNASTVIRRGGNLLTSLSGRFDEVYEVEFIVRLPTITSVALLLTIGDNHSAGANYARFEFDTDVDNTVNCLTRSSTTGLTTPTDTNITPTASAWYVFTIRQSTVGTVVYLINDAVVATHSTNVPSSQLVNVYVYLATRTTTLRTLDVDYVSFDSQDLGARTN